MLKLALHFGNARQVPELQPYIYRTTKYKNAVVCHLQNVSQLTQPKKMWGINRFLKCQTRVISVLI